MTVKGKRTSLETPPERQASFETPALRRQEASGPTGMVFYPKNPERPTPLSYAQERMWFLEQLIEKSAVYNITFAHDLTGSLHLDALRQSINQLVVRHETLRTRFVMQDGLPVQEIAPALSIEIPVVDLSNLPEADRQAEANRLASEQASRPFDLESGPLLRTTLVKLGEADHVLIFSIHHIITDEWSNEILWRELSALYNAALQGQDPQLARQPIQYANFAQSQRRWVEASLLEDELAYWRKKLAGAPHTLEFPTDHPRSEKHLFRGATCTRWFPASLLNSLKAISQSERVTLFTILLAAFNACLARYTTQEELLVGTPVANRSWSEVEDVVGLFVNTLVLRSDLSGNPNFRQFLHQMSDTVIQALDHQNLPFDQLVSILKPEREISRNPLVQVMFVLKNAADRELKLSGLSTRSVYIPNGTSKIDLTLFLHPQRDGIHARLDYNCDLFEEETIQSLLDHYQVILEGILADPNQPVYCLPLLTAHERRRLLYEWNTATKEYRRDRCIHELFEEQAGRSPDEPALFCAGRSLTYTEVNRRSNQLAHYLRKLGVRPNTLVGLMLERSVEMGVGILGILKAGGAYLPLDPAYPAERLDFMIEDAQVDVLLTQAQLVPPPKPGMGESDRFAGLRSQVCLDEDWSKISRESDQNPENCTSPQDLAYLIYTSGSTGRPKGVMIGHHSAVNLITGLHEAIYSRLPAGRLRVGLNAPLSFDASVKQLLVLLLGHTLHILPQDVRQDGQACLAYLREHRLDVLDCVPTQLKLLLEAGLLDGKGWAPLAMLIGGEAIDADTWRILANAPATDFFNMYGPTECTVDALIGRVKDTPDRPVIGRPVANTRLYVLDSRQQPVPVGVPGELYIGGEGVARGYLHRPELTEEKFIDSRVVLSQIVDHGKQQSLDDYPTKDYKTNDHVTTKLDNYVTTRLYRTGDMVRWLADGNVEFLGRIDGQVKLRGFRIELGEIEAELGRHPGVRQCVAVVREAAPTDSQGWCDKQLVAYVVPAEGVRTTPTDLRSHLKKRLPEYMLPSAYVFLEALPLTPNGKINRRALPAPDPGAMQNPLEGEAPCGPLETKLAAIWEEILGIKPVGRHDNFFDLGGHSLLAIRVFNRIKTRLGASLPVSSLFQAPTVAGLAELICQGKRSDHWEVAVPIQPSCSRPPLFLVHGFAGGVTGYARLAKLLGSDQPLYGLQARGIDGKREPHTRIEDMAWDYIQEMRAVQPGGPYFLGGYCFGGLVAYEMACQLRAQGETVGLVAILEGYAPRAAEKGAEIPAGRKLINFLQNLPSFFKEFLALSQNEKASLFRVRFSRMKKSLKRKAGLSVEYEPEDFIAEDITQVEPHLRQVMMNHIEAARMYRPCKYPGRIDLFRVRRLSLFRATDPLMGWGTLAAEGIEVHRIEGAHRNILQPPQVETLAIQLRACLEGECAEK